MLFVPLPLFITFCLAIFLIRMLRASDMRHLPNQIFAALVALFTVQSALLNMRWGYGIDAVAYWIAMLAVLLPATAYLAYKSLMTSLRLTDAWHLLVLLPLVVASWAAPNLVDVLIILVFLAYGIALWVKSGQGGDGFALVRISGATDASRAMRLTGLVLIASACVDIYVIVDFIQYEGRHVGSILTLVQALFLLIIGVSAIVAQSKAVEIDDAPAIQTKSSVQPTQTDAEIVSKITELFKSQGLHRDSDLNLRRIARRLSLPDRAISNAINRTQGKSVSQFVNGFRIDDARQMIAQTDMSILQISMAAGFMTKSNFNREFVRIVGETPTQYRSAHPSEA